MILPEDRTYKIEVIDTWNETRETVMEGAKGDRMVRYAGEREDGCDGDGGMIMRKDSEKKK